MRVLFVCVDNSCRSQIAEAFANLLGVEGVEAYSAGSDPAGSVNPQAVKVMSELGYDLRSHPTRSLEDVPDVEFDYAVTMGCGDECPMVKARMHIDWDVPDPKGMNIEEFRRVRDMIRERVQRLLVAPRARVD
ncbi:MAG: arsenate reductase ArsC [Proteobacteria bacterium]|nr:arsenate reductase ArsC [Pseudomonadota bacterium]